MKFMHIGVWLLGVSLLGSAQAQKLDDAWHGRWASPDTQLDVSAKNFRVGKQSCRWVDAPPKRAFKGCIAHYSDAFTKAQLMTFAKERAEAINEYVKINMYDAKTAAAERKSLADTRAIIDKLGTAPLKPVVIQDAAYEGSGDCASSYFMDQSRVFNLLQCAGGDGSFAITELKKRP